MDNKVNIKIVASAPTIVANDLKQLLSTIAYSPQYDRYVEVPSVGYVVGGGEMRSIAHVKDRKRILGLQWIPYVHLDASPYVKSQSFIDTAIKAALHFRSKTKEFWRASNSGQFRQDKLTVSNNKSRYGRLVGVVVCVVIVCPKKVTQKDIDAVTVTLVNNAEQVDVYILAECGVGAGLVSTDIKDFIVESNAN